MKLMTILMMIKNLSKENNRLNKILTKSLNFFRLMPYRVKVFVGGFFLLSISLLFIQFYFTHPKVSDQVSIHFMQKVHNESTLQNSLDYLNAQTPLDLTFHPEVEKYVNLYLGERSEALSRMLSRSRLYFPIIESELDKYSLPLELKYLAVVESGLNPLAKSPSGAVGLWQFLYNTTTLLDLEVNSYIDERRDVLKSTYAACRYLDYLYTTFNDWNLALAAYNGGPGEVRKAIERSGGKTNYWEIRPYLSKQAANYVPAFIAFNYLFENADELGIEIAEPDFYYHHIDSIHLKSEAYLSVVSEIIGLPMEQICFLNPIYTKDLIPKSKEPLVLILPKNKVSEFIRNEAKIYQTQPGKDTYTQLKANAARRNGRVCLTYIVKKGDFFHKLALKHDCTIENIMAWNELETNKLYPGQTLKIWVKQ